MRDAVPTTNDRPLRRWSQDESRWGLMTLRRRRITVRGVKPVGRIQHQYANSWCFGCVAPATGESYFPILPKLDAATMQIFLDHFAVCHRDTFNLLVVDRSGAHTAKTLRIPEHIALLFLPARSPELNPIERVWEDVRKEMAWKRFAHLDCLEDELEAVLATYTTERLQSLSGYPYLVDAELAITS
ncbi:Transposase [Oscillochloris trichoides DG-6]|uniref:Transposase n=1 Tax=Oscillochloris trichoides DG-6 TaxID=765420 RepID=E1I9Y8_9CHLR|nr:Transposase [Oscillochloris trichoides DG-6]